MLNFIRHVISLTWGILCDRRKEKQSWGWNMGSMAVSMPLLLLASYRSGGGRQEDTGLRWKGLLRWSRESARELRVRPSWGPPPGQSSDQHGQHEALTSVFPRLSVRRLQ